MKVWKDHTIKGVIIVMEKAVNSDKQSKWSNKIEVVTLAGAFVPGDVNGDGEVTAVDITCLYNFLLDGDDSAIINGDQNGDGEITANDVTFVYNILLGS